MDGVIPARNGKAPVRYTWGQDGAVQDIEPLENIQEESALESSALESSSRILTSKGSKSMLTWPFHHRGFSDAASTTATSHFRRATAHSKSWFRSAEDSASVLSRSLVPDYVVNYIRGETPETLAKKREKGTWGQRDVTVTPQRERFVSQHGYFEDPWASSTQLTPGKYANEGRQRGFRRYLGGWRGGVTLNAILSLVILIVTVVCLAIIAAGSKGLPGEFTIFAGSCTTASNMNIGLHALINVLTIIALAGANYVFQVLSSPTRAEVAKAHDKKQLLDIGIPSIRNFLHISSLRTALATILVVVVIAIQVIYNAALFTSSTASDGVVASVTETTLDESRCNVVVSKSLLGIVALLNIVTIFCFGIVLSWKKFEPLATLGDAIRSFLRKPDPTTRGDCLLTKKNVKHGEWGHGEARTFVPGKHYWCQTPSVARWLLMVSSWLALFAPATVALGLNMAEDPQRIATPFGKLASSSIYAFPAPTSRAQLAILAALPQLLLVILGITTNAHLTTYYVSHELTLFALGPRPLRVSSDVIGTQRTSLYLTLPRPVSWLLYAFFAAIGFILSQTVSPAVIASSRGSDTDSGEIRAISISMQALVVLLVLLLALLLFVLGLGLRRAPTAVFVDGQAKGNPLALKGGSCSAALSAKCHPSPNEPELWQHDLSWGVVSERFGSLEGHCTFSAMSVGAVDVGQQYA